MVGSFTLVHYAESGRHDRAKNVYHPYGGADIELAAPGAMQTQRFHVDDPRTAKALKEIWIAWLLDDNEQKQPPAIALTIETMGFVSPPQ